jgi:hypothetical protein
MTYLLKWYLCITAPAVLLLLLGYAGWEIRRSFIARRSTAKATGASNV